MHVACVLLINPLESQGLRFPLLHNKQNIVDASYGFIKQCMMFIARYFSNVRMHDGKYLWFFINCHLKILSSKFLSVVFSYSLDKF